MLTAFAANAEGVGRLVCVEPPICLPLALLFQHRRFRDWVASERTRRVLQNMVVYSPYVWIPSPISRYRFTHRFCQQAVGRQVDRVIRGIGGEALTRVAWVFRPEQYAWLGAANEDVALYECYDEYSLDSRSGKPIAKAARDESILLRGVQLVIATSESLWRKRSLVHHNVHLVPNGVDVDLFNTESRAGSSLPSDMAGIKRPIIGYAGRLGRFIDWGLLSYLAESRPEWSFVLLGGFDGNVDEVGGLRHRVNVHWLGWKPREMVPAYSIGFDVSILPLLANEYLHCSSPLTLWEQLALGNVVVMTDLREVHRFGEYVFLASCREQFLASIEAALKGDNSRRIRLGIAAARERSWERNAKRLISLVAETVAKKRSEPRR